MNRRIDDEAHELELRGAVKLEVSRTGSATKGLQAFTRLETVYANGQPIDIATTVGLFITDALWEQLGQPLTLAVTMEPTR